MKDFITKLIYKNNFILYIYIKIKKFFYKPNSQSNESSIVVKLIEKYKINGNFLEIGFSPWEYNCSKITDRFEGLIIDADSTNIKIGKWLYKKTKFLNEFIHLDNINKIIKNINFKVEILSLDIDGNDYYIMEKLIFLNPSIIICEYNPTFYTRPITIKYRKDFDRTKASKNWVYYGCSLKGWELFMKKNNYSMIKISNSGVNVFFIKDNLLKKKDVALSAEKNFIDYNWPDDKTHEYYWNKIKDMEFIKIV
tara:strand:+ start:347 stop:1102 length:756 start_codon:yes stop_codon:yes gene_type:complete